MVNKERERERLKQHIKAAPGNGDAMPHVAGRVRNTPPPQSSGIEIDDAVTLKCQNDRAR